MTTNQLLNLDWRKNNNREKLSKALLIIPPLKKIANENGDIGIKEIQKAIHIMCNKYEMFVKIMQDPQSGDKCDIWSCYIYNQKNLKQINKIYSISLEELVTKLAIALYSEVRKRKE